MALTYRSLGGFASSSKGLTSLYFAVRTLRLAERDDRLLDPEHKVKITRAEVYRTIAATRALAPSNLLVRMYFRRLAGDDWRPAPELLRRPEA